MRYALVVLSLSAILSFMPGVAGAQNDSCLSILQLSKTVETVVSNEESVEEHAASFCNEYFKTDNKSKSKSFGASYKFLAGSFAGGSASQESVASKYCSSASDGRQKKDAFKHYIETIAPGGFDALQTCMRLQQDIKFNIGGYLSDYFNMTVTFVSKARGLKNADIKVSPSPGVTCHWDKPSAAHADRTTLETGGKADLTCTRSDITKKAFVSVFATDIAENEMTLQWKAYSAEGHPIASLEYLQSEIISLQGKVDALNAALHGRSLVTGKQETAKIHNKPDHNYSVELVCPTDSIVVGYHCEVTSGAGNLQNVALLPQMNARCTWNNITGPFAAKGWPICLKFGEE